jgi:DNA-binding XRE family transcriptional regulator
MQNDWLWDRNINLKQARRILANPQDGKFAELAALLLSRQNSAREVFSGYLTKGDFTINWNRIKKEMRKNSWNDPRIEYWQAIYEKLRPRFALPKNAQAEGKVISDFCHDFGEKIEAARKNKSLTQGEIAKMLGISQQIISRIESGKQNITLMTLFSLCKALGIKEIKLTV